MARGSNGLSRSVVKHLRNPFIAARFASTKSEDGTKTKSMMSWSRGYLGVGASTKRPDATFIAGKIDY